MLPKFQVIGIQDSVELKRELLTLDMGKLSFKVGSRGWVGMPNEIVSSFYGNPCLKEIPHIPRKEHMWNWWLQEEPRGR